MAKAAKKTAMEQDKPEETIPKAYRITSKADGFRRGGIVHAGTREYGLDELSEAQLALIEAEPLLILEKLEIEEVS